MVYVSIMQKILRFLLSAFLVTGLSMAGANSAFAIGPYLVPADGLSFDTRVTTPCTTGYGNDVTLFPDADDDEVNFLKATDSLTYTNVATIGGQVIDATVTLTSISGMQEQDFSGTDEAALDRLDKCDPTDPEEAHLIEIDFDNDSTSGIEEEAYFVLDIAFFLGGTSTPATLTNLKMNVVDIDNDQYFEVDNFTSTLLADGRAAGNLQEYGDSTFTANGTSVTLTGMGTARRFHATGDGDLEPDKHVVEVTYASVSSLSFKLGSYGEGSGSFDIEFRGFSFASDSGGSGGSGSATAESLATTGSSSSMWGMAIGGLGFVIAGAVLAMQGLRRRSLTEG